MQYARTALVSGLLIVVCALGTVSAEGENPTTPPVEGGLMASVADSNTPGPEASDPDSTSEGVESAVVPTPEPNPWQPVVDSLRPSYWAASILPAQGLAMYYNPGVFQRVLDFRYAHNHISQCAECIGYVALLRAGDMDRRVWLKRQNRIAEGPFWVVDVAARRDIPGLLSRHWVVDIDHKTAMRWRMAGPIPITVYAAESPEAQEFAAAYFSSEMIPLDERYIIPPEAHSYRTGEDGPSPAPSEPTNQPALQIAEALSTQASLSDAVVDPSADGYKGQHSAD
ncbi:MAG: hypothetical protein KJZ86_02255 [Caldilineaceae bacterium]|nr:hypothetical protein [Caldilineaceae bacterium]HRJ40579.1 hypothetical protein [Caldilineaceae bacterium]